jgi:hypothetical protein
LGLESLTFHHNPLLDPPSQIIDQGNTSVIAHLLKQEAIRYKNKLEMRGIESRSTYLDVIPELWFDMLVQYMLSLRLIVSQNWIASIPDSISKMIEIRYFDVSNNRSAVLAPTIGCLSKLSDEMKWDLWICKAWK